MMTTPTLAAASVVTAKLGGIWPEIAMGLGATLCLILGLARTPAIRRSIPALAGLTLLVAGVLIYLGCFSPAYAGPGDTVGFRLDMTAFVKLAAVAVGLLLLLVAAGLPDSLRQTREAEEAALRGRFEPGDILRGEFFAFFLLSLTGLMLTAGADDLVWLFLSLELVSLPTYVMVATSRDRVWAQEAAVKYFFLGALAVAVFLYGFALIYGATGTTVLYGSTPDPSLGTTVREFVVELRAAGQPLPPMLVAGLVLAVVGISFKIAAVPMHFYAADVYEGAASPVTAFLAFVPKAAGFLALILLLGVIGWPLPPALFWLLWGVAALTMTVGNVLGLLQQSVKRVLAYSSIAHSGYMLVGLLAGPAIVSTAAPGSALTTGGGLAAVLFYLVAYGLATLASFAVLACLQKKDGDEAESFDDLGGLVRRHPMLAGVMLLSVLSLIGLPPLVGFLGKVYLFAPAVSQSGGEPAMLWLVIIAVLNSAVSAAYYLRIAAAMFFGEGSDDTHAVGGSARRVGALVAATLALILGLSGGALVNLARDSARLPVPAARVPAPPANLVHSTR